MSYIDVVPNKSNEKVFAHLSKMDQHFKSGVHEAYIVIAEYLKRTNKKDFAAPKHGRFYRLRVHGKMIRHRASAPGEPPARITGALGKTLKTKTSGFTQMDYSAGGGRVDYAGYLEEGTRKMEPRPYLSKAISDNEGISVITFYKQIGRRLRCD